MELSKRLETIAGAVTPGHIVADIGTDHGYVPIYLLKKGISPGAFAMDVNPGPLDRAREHIKREKLEDYISVLLSDGLDRLSTDETDTVVIAGMGGELICRILKDAPEFLRAGKEFILQPQSEWFKVRRFLYEHEYEILKEWFLKEDGKYYVVIKAVPETAAIYSEESCLSENKTGMYSVWIPDPDMEICFRYGRNLMLEKDHVLCEYLMKEYRKKSTILFKMEERGRKQLPGFKKIKKEMEDIDMILRRCYNVEIFPE